MTLISPRSQIHPDPLRSTQIHPDPPRSTQIHPDPPRSIQIHTDPPRSTQILQIRPDLSTSTQQIHRDPPYPNGPCPDHHEGRYPRRPPGTFRVSFGAAGCQMVPFVVILGHLFKHILAPLVSRWSPWALPGTALGQAGHFWSPFWIPFGTLGVKVAPRVHPRPPPGDLSQHFCVTPGAKTVPNDVESSDLWVL